MVAVMVGYSSVINVDVVTPDMSVMFCACQADKGDLLKQKLAPATTPGHLPMGILWVCRGQKPRLLSPGGLLE